MDRKIDIGAGSDMLNILCHPTETSSRYTQETSKCENCLKP